MPVSVAAVIGDPVRHSRSPAIHNAAFAAAGLDWLYTAFEVPAGAGADALMAMRVLNLRGLSVTMPLKAEVAAAADSADEVVRALGAANCVVPDARGGLHATNTDGAGFLAGLADDAGCDVYSKRVVVLGAGGAAKAVAHAAGHAGAADVCIVNRTLARAEAAAALAGSTGRVGTLADIGAADIIVNATPVGMAGGSRDSAGPSVADIVVHATPAGMAGGQHRSSGGSGIESMPCDPHSLNAGQVAVDLIYEPLETPWLAALRSRGVEAHNGISMLVHQAAAAFKLWTGYEAPLEAMKKAVII